MKKILISEKQANMIREALENGTILPISMDGSPLMDNPAIPMNGRVLNKMAEERFDEIKGYFSDDITSYGRDRISSELNSLIAKCQKKERGIRKQLETICLNTLSTLFSIPSDEVSISCELCDEIPADKDFHIYPDTKTDYIYDDVESMDNDTSAVQKRQVINALVTGGSMRLMNEAKKHFLGQVFDIDEDLPHIYSKIMKINDYLVFTEKVEIKDRAHHQGSYVDVILGDEEKQSKIEVKAVIFPLLMQEAIKGLLELIAAHGLPDDKDMASRAINVADALENNPWDMRLGPILWDALNCNDTKILPDFLYNLVSLPNEDFFSSMKEIFAGTRKGQEITDSMKSEISRNVEYDDFQNTLHMKQQKSMIADEEYFTAEELDEASYPSNFNIEEFKSLSSFAARVRYCEERLNRISQGSSRIVYAIDDKTVLKLAKNKKGVAQNEEEGQYDYYKQGMGLFAEVYDVDENYLWIEMQLAKKAKPSDFKRITGYDFNTVCEWLNYIKPDNRRRTYMDPKYKAYFNSNEFQDNYDEYSILAKLQDYVGNYDAPIGDLKRISSWGIVTDENGEDDLVLIDFGLSDDVYNNFYSRR